MIDPKELKDKASDRKKMNKKLFRRIQKQKPPDLDEVMLDLHNHAFEHINCLDCANCCKSISPFLIDKDIQKISRYLKSKPSEFVSEYLSLDNEGDYVFKRSPCPFLGDGNYCSIYDVRPRACREYPHTDRKRIIQLLGLTLKNASVCPAVFEMVEKLHTKY